MPAEKGALLKDRQKQLDRELTRMFRERYGDLMYRESKLSGLNPLNILERGYSLVYDRDGKLVKNAADVRPGEDLTIRPARGSIAATVKNAQQTIKP